MKKFFIVSLLLSCLILFLVGCGSEQRPMAGHREDIGLGETEPFNPEFIPGFEQRIRERIDIESESPWDGFRVTPELAIDIANAVFLSWRYYDWSEIGFNAERTEYSISDLGDYYVVSRWLPAGYMGVVRSVAICKTNGRIIQIFIH